jgi:hypothetical protein
MKIFSDGFLIEIITLSPDMGEAISRILWIGLPSQAGSSSPQATPTEIPARATASPFPRTDYAKPVKKSHAMRLPATNSDNTRNCTNEYNGATRLTTCETAEGIAAKSARLDSSAVAAGH